MSEPFPSSICVFCGARFGNHRQARDLAAKFGEILARERITLVYGGGGVGLMGVLANAALKAGARVVGVIPRFLLQREAGHPALNETVVVETMHERKRQMFERADAFVVLPGGIGTLEEFFEVLSWRTLGLHAKPIAILDIEGYWKPLAALLRGVVDGGFAAPTHLDHVVFVDDLADVLPALASAPRVNGPQKELDRL
ncbi:MAG: TIGR00730 family Rossman fold protein [Proteobacteria bacterium]|nr:TIGR00730 family Rossman fold protein [Pseudomonadota bacterium]